MKQREKIAIAFVAGFAAVYVLKYGIFGLEAWDKFLHPARLAADTMNSRFTKPLLGIFSRSVYVPYAPPDRAVYS